MDESQVVEYNRLRMEAYATTSLLLNEKISNEEFESDQKSYLGTNVSFSEITRSAFEEYVANWHDHRDRINDWDWREWHRSVRNSPSRFEAALWVIKTYADW